MSLGRPVLILAAIVAAVFGLLAGCGAGMCGFSLAEPVDFAWAFTALAWMSVTLAPAVALTFVGLAVLLGGIALCTKGFRSVPRLLESHFETVLMIEVCALAPVVLLSIGPFVLWPIFWLETGFGSCVPGDCDSVPAVP